MILNLSSTFVDKSLIVSKQFAVQERIALRRTTILGGSNASFTLLFFRVCIASIGITICWFFHWGIPKCTMLANTILPRHKIHSHPMSEQYLCTISYIIYMPLTNCFSCQTYIRYNRFSWQYDACRIISSKRIDCRSICLFQCLRFFYEF